MEGIGQWFHNFAQNVIDGLGDTLEWVLDLLPDSPFTAISNVDVSGYMGWLNWLVPITQMVAILQTWVTAIIAYYLYVIILRWIKAVS